MIAKYTGFFFFEGRNYNSRHIGHILHSLHIAYEKEWRKNTFEKYVKYLECYNNL